MKVNMSKKYIQDKIAHLDAEIEKMTRTQTKHPTESRTAYIKLLDEKRESYKRLLPHARDKKIHAKNLFEATKPTFKIDAKHQKGKYI